MTAAARERRKVRAPMLALSAMAWIALLAAPERMMLHVHPSAMPGPASLAMLRAHNSPAALAASWGLMLIAMMLPLVITPVRYLRASSLARSRGRATGLFLAGYAAMWMAAGAVLLMLAFVVRQFAADSWWSLAAAILVTLAWECSPVKQRCLNRGHAHPAIAAFGPAADLDALRFGVTHGFWCVGSCWALMLLPLLASRGHMFAMAGVALLVAAQKVDRPLPLRWRLRLPVNAARLVFAQVRTLLAPEAQATPGGRIPVPGGLSQ